MIILFLKVNIFLSLFILFDNVYANGFIHLRNLSMPYNFSLNGKKDEAFLNSKEIIFNSDANKEFLSFKDINYPDKVFYTNKYSAVVLLKNKSKEFDFFENYLTHELLEHGVVVLKISLENFFEKNISSFPKENYPNDFINDRHIASALLLKKAFSFLSKDNKVDNKRIGILGFEEDGKIVRLMMDMHVNNVISESFGDIFSVHVEIFNTCESLFEIRATTGAPLISFRSASYSLDNKKKCIEKDFFISKAGSPVEVYIENISPHIKHRDKYLNIYKSDDASLDIYDYINSENYIKSTVKKIIYGLKYHLKF